MHLHEDGPSYDLLYQLSRLGFSKLYIIRFECHLDLEIVEMNADVEELIVLYDTHCQIQSQVSMNVIRCTHS